MLVHRCTGIAILGLALLSAAGCSGETPPERRTRDRARGSPRKAAAEAGAAQGEPEGPTRGEARIAPLSRQVSFGHRVRHLAIAVVFNEKSCRSLNPDSP